MGNELATPCKYNGHWKHFSFPRTLIALQLKNGTFKTSMQLKNDEIVFYHLIICSLQLPHSYVSHRPPSLRKTSTSSDQHWKWHLFILFIHIVNHLRGCWGKKFLLGVKLYQTAVSLFLAVQWASEQMLRLHFLFGNLWQVSIYHVLAG